MSTLKVNTILNAAGTGTPAIDGLAKAWVNFNGTGTVAIRAAFNVSSITDNAVGDYTVNFTNAMADSNYVAAGLSTRNTAQASPRQVTYADTNTKTASQFRIETEEDAGSNTDMVHVFLAIFR